MEKASFHTLELARLRELKAQIGKSQLSAAQRLVLPPEIDDQALFFAHAAAWAQNEEAVVVGRTLATLLEQLLAVVEELESVEAVAYALAREKGTRKRGAESSGRSGANTRHSAPGGARARKAAALKAWANRCPSDTKDKVAERVSIENGWSFETTRKYLKGAP